MSSSTLKIVAAAMVILALLAASVAYRVVQNYSRQAQAATQAREAEQSQTPKTLAVVAIRPLTAFEPIAEDDVNVVPLEVAPPDFFASVDEVVGRSPVVDLDIGAPITPRFFRGQSALARVIPQDHKALSVEVDDVVAVGGFVRPGDIVDVLLFVRGSGGSAATQTRTLLREAQVLGFDSRIIDRPDGASAPADGSNRRRVQTAVLAVPDDDVNRFVLGASVGGLRLALHRAQDEAGEDPADADGLPLLVPDDAELLTPDADQAIALAAPITLEELTVLKAKQDDAPKPPPPPPPVYVYRGNDLQAVRP